MRVFADNDNAPLASFPAQAGNPSWAGARVYKWITGIKPVMTMTADSIAPSLLSLEGALDDD